MIQIDARQRAAMHSLIAEDISAFARRKELMGTQELHEVCEDLHGMLDLLVDNNVDVTHMRMQLNASYACMV